MAGIIGVKTCLLRTLMNIFLGALAIVANNTRYSNVLTGPYRPAERVGCTKPLAFIEGMFLNRWEDTKAKV